MRILLGADGSRCALAAAHGLARWLRPTEARVDLLTVVPPSRVDPPERWRARVSRWQDAAEDPLGKRGHRVNRLTRSGEPTRVLVEMSGLPDYDLAVIGARGRDGPSPAGIGSSALALLDRAPIPVLMVREPPAGLREGGGGRSARRRPYPALLATDGPPHSRGTAKRFCALFGCAPLEAEILAVVPAPRVTEGRRAAMASEQARLIRDAERIVRRDLVPVENELRGRRVEAATRLLEGDPVTSVVARASASRAELLVLGCRAPPRPGAARERGPSDAPLGHAALEIVRSTTCSILRVRDPAGAGSPGPRLDSGVGPGFGS